MPYHGAGEASNCIIFSNLNNSDLQVSNAKGIKKITLKFKICIFSMSLVELPIDRLGTLDYEITYRPGKRTSILMHYREHLTETTRLRYRSDPRMK